VLVVTGPSGVGKGTVIRELLRRTPGLELSISATTRAPRPGERDGIDYHFLDEAEFRRRLAAGRFLEHAEYAGNWYGTPRSELERDCRALVLEIELQGARQVAEALPEAVRVFIAPPSLAALRERRLAVAERELGAQDEFAHVVENDRLDDAVRELVALVDTMFPAQPSAAGLAGAERRAAHDEEGPQ
jgi:guanylate kinase